MKKLKLPKHEDYDRCRDCGRRLPDKDEWECECGATYTRDIQYPNE